MSQIPLQLIPERRVYSVTELSREIKGALEGKFPDVWVTGEVSNFRAASSGHFYFTLKDSNAQLRAVCFRNQARYLKFKPQDGISVIARGRLSVYEARGEYQLYIEHLEPAGLGALQLAFEQLKAKLAREGLFESSRKKHLPVLPRTVGIVTSPSGAAVRDIVRVLRRRYPNLNVLLFPARVQGEGATGEIAGGIEYFNRHGLADVLIVGRGGGSLEDLWAFNEEVVARAIAASRIPVISAVGHETDFTIADFVADLRAPTPSAAAELVVHRKQDFVTELHHRTHRLTQVLRLKLSEAREFLTGLRKHSVFQTLAARVAERAQRVDDALAEINRLMAQKLSDCRHNLLETSAGVIRYDFSRLIQLKMAALAECNASLTREFSTYLNDRKARLTQAKAILIERSPLTILSRGYSITRDSAGRILHDAAQVSVGDSISVHLARGELGATVRDKKP